MNKKLKIGLIFTFNVSLKTWKEKGLFSREIRLYEELLNQNPNLELYLFTYGEHDREYEQELPANITVVPMPRIFNCYFGKILYSVLMPLIHRNLFKDLDIIKTNQMIGAWTAMIASWLFKKPLIVRTGYTWSLFEKNKIKKIIADLLESISCKKADVYLVASREDKMYLLRKHKCEVCKILPNYVDTNRFRPLSVSKQRLSAVFVGRFVSQKNLDVLIQSLEKLPSVCLSLYGHGELLGYLEQLARALRVCVHFFAPVPNEEIPLILNKYQIFVLPSLYEGMPKALLEAMSCGLACIATNVPGNREVIDHMKTGLLVDVSLDSIRGAIFILVFNPKLAKKLGRTARNKLMKDYSLQVIAKQELCLYHAITNRGVHK
ncbi:hypothetical protein TEU_03850 [Thermococcus eurythermalis]|uniref:Glycosyl transferase family 1 domain-containing protein n=1 Tax=Thermococcus eurythermalis TaxID=1505907 RepID=A0A097QSR6_9EURY|nr:glycosyltransferase [Thermococcus eurythermalis]AIU69545.1 hypothetical protein TEU_03850 [Thermococcus eurythermalis]